MPHAHICVFGEVLFDRFPDGHAVLGGAPFNVAWHLQAFGERPHFLSAVGDDAPGRQIRQAMADWGMDMDGLGTDPEHATGEVVVSLEGGEPSYDIRPDRAYDQITPPAAGPGCDLLYHGTLALRGARSAQTLTSIRSGGIGQIFLDVNLRDPWWTREQVLGLVDGAHWVKLNRDELDLLQGGEAAERSQDLAARAAAFREAHGLQGLILTLGAEGALGLDGELAPVTVTPPGNVQVVDAVGAGDAFAAVSILGLSHDWSLADTLERAQAFAARIVGQRGATAADPLLYAPFIEQWGLGGTASQ
ncbi:MAG: PfkB family carbohydrate kinase [Bdellovibrio bacteriovorus]